MDIILLGEETFLFELVTICWFSTAAANPEVYQGEIVPMARNIMT